MIRAGNEHYGFDFAAAVMLAQATVVEWSKVTELAFTVGLGSGTETKSFPVAVQEGDIVLVGLACDIAIDPGGAGAGGIQTAGYTNLENVTTSDVPGHQAAYKIMGATPDTDVVIAQQDVGGNAGKQAGVLQVWRSVDVGTPLDVARTVATGSSGMPNPPSITPVTNGSLIVIFGFVDDENVTDVSAPSGYGDLLAQEAVGGGAEATATVMMASKIQATAAAEDSAAFGGSGSDAWRAVTAALRKKTA